MTIAEIDNVEIALGTNYDISLAQGGTYNLILNAVSGETSDTEVPFPLTGYRAHLQIRKRAGTSGTPLVDCTSAGDDPDLLIEPNDEHGDPQIGRIEIRIPANKTVVLTKNCAYDIFIIDESDATQAVRLLHGVVNVSRSVTVN